jgi:hypothetical protein
LIFVLKARRGRFLELLFGECHWNVCGGGMPAHVRFWVSPSGDQSLFSSCEVSRGDSVIGQSCHFILWVRGFDAAT